MNKQLICLDFDGVIFGSERLKAQSWEEAFSRIGIPGMGEFYRENMGLPGDELIKLVERDARVLENPNYNSTNVHQRRREIYKKLQSGGVPYIESTLEFIRKIPEGFPICLVSTNEVEHSRKMLERVGVLEKFLVVVGKEDVPLGKSKPHPDLYIKAIEKAEELTDGNIFNEGIAVEDSQIGVNSALGVGACHIDYWSVVGFGNNQLKRTNLIVDDLSKYSVEELFEAV